MRRLLDENPLGSPGGVPGTSLALDRRGYGDDNDLGVRRRCLLCVLSHLESRQRPVAEVVCPRNDPRRWLLGSAGAGYPLGDLPDLTLLRAEARKDEGVREYTRWLCSCRGELGRFLSSVFRIHRTNELLCQDHSVPRVEPGCCKADWRSHPVGMCVFTASDLYPGDWAGLEHTA